MKANKPTSIDIAYLAGVSQPTVSRALRNSPLVSKETRERVQEIARRLNYKVDINARNLRSKSSRTIALLFCEDPGTGNSLINPFFLSMLGSITKASATRGYDLLISFQQDSEDWQADYEDAHKADGIIFLGYGDYTTYIEKITRLDEMQAHFITWGPVLEGQPGAFLGCDNVDGCYQAVKHLLSLGRRRVAFLGDASTRAPEFLARYQGYCKALDEANIRSDLGLLVSADTTEAAGIQAIQALLKRGQTFDAVVAASDLIAIGAMKALEDADIKIPKDVAVVGFDDIPLAAFANPPLTTIHQDTILAGRLLVDSLIRLIEGESIAPQKIPGKLVVRNSCGAERQGR